MKTPNIFKNIFLNIIHNNNQILNKSLNFIILFSVLFLLIILQPATRMIKLNVGDVLKKDIVANKEIKYIDKKATKRKEEIIKVTTPPVYIFDSEITEKRINQIKNLFKNIFITKNFDGITKLAKAQDISITFEEYKTLLNIENRDKEFLKKFLNIFSEISKKGIIDIDDSNLSNLELSGIWVGKYDGKQLINNFLSIDEVDTLETIINKIQNKIEINFKYLKASQKKILLNTYQKLFIPNIIYNKEMSELQLKNKIKTESIIYRTIKKDQNIARKGDIITNDNIDKIKSVMTNKEILFSVNNIISLAIFLLSILSLIYYFVYHFEPKVFDELKNHIFISIIIILYVLYLSLPIYLGYDKFHAYYGLFVPISAFSLTILFLYSRILSAFFPILLSLVFYYISGYNNLAFLFVFFSGITSVFIISKITRRVDLLIAGLKISLVNILISIFIILSITSKEIQILYFLIFAICNGVLSSVFAIGIILAGEIMLNSPTVFRLQELGDSSSPLLKLLFKTAIGTYNHSIIVGNLAESAALEIGANGLLAKIGGYYHDIGKIDNPEYFVENQSELNKHETLKPSISVSIIKAHVKSGVERAKKAKLPQKVIDIIAQHHGNTLIRYFYEEAIKNISPDKEEIQKIDFHYKNQNPDFPEAAIVLLADQVEAATRALKKYTMTNIEKLIKKIIDEKFQERILDDSGLTLKDFTKIKKIFCKIVTGMYHPRIEYPSSNIDEEKPKNVSKKTNGKSQPAKQIKKR